MKKLNTIAAIITEGPDDKIPGCVYNPGGVACKPEDRRCQACGWNPAVATARLQKRFPGYKPGKV